MKIDLNMGKTSKPSCMAWYLDKGRHDPLGSIATISTMSGIPVIVVLHWIAEIEGFTSQLIERKKDIIKFYGYIGV